MREHLVLWYSDLVGIPPSLMNNVICAAKKTNLRFKWTLSMFVSVKRLFLLLEHKQMSESQFINQQLSDREIFFE